MYELFSVDWPPLSFALPRDVWHAVLPLAHCGGWQPRGTNPPPGYEVFAAALDARTITQIGVIPWHEGYRHADGQSVIGSDACALANGLENMLDDIPAHDVHTADCNLLELFSGPKKDSLRRLITFMRLGAFTIHECTDIYP